nr:flocculation protein FLO11-like [Ipomoea batatas]
MAAGNRDANCLTSDSTETEESSDFEAYYPPAEESSNGFGVLAISCLRILRDSLLIFPFSTLLRWGLVLSVPPGSIQIVPREGLRFDGIIKSCKRWKERFVFVRPAGRHLIFLLLGLLITLSLTGRLRRLGVSPASSGFPRPRSGAGGSGSGIPSFDAVGPSASISSRGAISYEMASQHDVLREQFRRLTRSHTARSAALPPLPTKGPGDKGKKPVDEPSAPPAFASSPLCALADSGTLRKRARAEPAEEELSDSSMCGTRFNYDPLEWAEKVVFPRDQEHMQTISDEALHRRTVANLYRAVAVVSANRRRSRERSQELEEFNARFSDLTVRYQDQVEASRRSLTTQAELRRARQEAEEGRRDALASIRGASDDFALIGKDWLASPEGVQYALGMSLEDFYEGSRQMQQEIYATLQSSNPPFMPADLGLPPPLPSWPDRHLNEGPGSPILGSGVASEAHPPGFALSSGSGGRRQIPFDHAYLNSAANLQVLADLSNAEISLGPLDSVDGAGPQDVRGDVSSRAPGV